MAHTLFSKNITTKFIIASGLISLFTCVAYSSSYNSGKTKKKNSVKSSLSFGIHNKSLNMSIANGFYLKGSSHFTKNHRSEMIINMNSLYFQKGNNIYVLPIKQKVILSKFRAPQKSIF